MSIEHDLLLWGNSIYPPKDSYWPYWDCQVWQESMTGHTAAWTFKTTQASGERWTCEDCCPAQTQRAEPIQSSPLPELPFQKVGTDLFQWNGKEYLLVVNYCSCYIEVAQLSTTSSAMIIQHTNSIFARHDTPEVLVSDNGPRQLQGIYLRVQVHSCNQ